MLNVDRIRRTIDGRAVPFGVIGRAQLELPRRFLIGSLAWDEWPPLLLNHNNSLRVGRAIALHPTASFGLWASFRVSRGAKGDRALEMAATTHRWLSIGVNPDAEWRLSDDGVREFVRAQVLEVSLTADPVFK